MGRNKFAVARRSIWYILRMLLEVVALVALVLGVFTAGLYTSNIYIIVQDGMAKRAACILHNSDFSELTEYFTDEFLLTDTALQKGAYDGFDVESYDYRADMELYIALPWENEVEVHITEKLASIAASPKEQTEGALPPQLPAWPTTRCALTMVRRDGDWLIHALTVLETNPAEEPLPTPDMSLLDGGAAA